MAGSRAKGGQAPTRPDIPYGTTSGDVTRDRAIVWSRTDRPARMLVEWSTTESMQNARSVRGPRTTEAAGYTARVDLTGLPPGQRIFYRVHFEDLADSRNLSIPAGGTFSHRRATRATSPSRGLPTPWARAGASTRRGAACACTRRCASPARTFSFIPATRSTRTRRCRRKSSCPTARCGETSSRPRNRRSPKRSTSFAEITRTTCSTTTCGGSTGKFRNCGCGTTTRSGTTGTPE